MLYPTQPPRPGAGLSTPLSDHPVDSLRGTRVSANTLDTIVRRLGSEMPNITAYDIRLSVRDAGEVTTACGWVEIDGTRHDFRAEASATDRGATYYLDGEPRWWSEVKWLDRWFEDLWQEATADAGYDLDNEIDFDAHLRSEEKKLPNTRMMRHAGAHTARRILRSTEGLKVEKQDAFIVSLVREINDQRPNLVWKALENNETKEDRS